MSGIVKSGTEELGTVTTLAGSEAGFADGVGAAAKFSSPTDIGIDNAGNLYVVDKNNFRIRKILPDGTVSTLAGSTKGYADGIGVAAQFSDMGNIAVTRDGIVYVNDPPHIRKILPNGTVSTFELFREYRGHRSGYYARQIDRIAVNNIGELYIGVGSRINKILPSGLVTEFEVDTASCLYEIEIGYEDDDDVIYIVDQLNNRIIKILPDGTKHTLVAIDADFVGGPLAAQRIFSPRYLTTDTTGNLFITDNSCIRKIRPGGTLTTLAGMKMGFADGRGHEARFLSPSGLARKRDGVIYIVDSGNNRIRKMVIERFEVTNENASGSSSGASGFGASASSGFGSSGFGSSGSSSSSPPSGSSSSSSSASSPSSGSSSAAYSNFEGNALSSETRGRLWWQLNQMTCPTREADSHIPFVKSQLMLLSKTAEKTIESYKGKATVEQMATYQEHLRNIFTGVTASFTSLNSTSVKCAMLFTKMLKAHVPDGVNSDNLEDERGKYWSENWDKPEWSPLNQMILRGLVFHDEDGHCIPSCKNKGIVVLLGEMTLYELIWSYANDLYFIGLPTGVAYADSEQHTPLSFLEHDCEHMELRADIDEVFSHPSFLPEFKRAELIRRKRRTIENKNILKCLQYIRDKPKTIQDAVLMIFFLIVHEQLFEDIMLDDVVSLELLSKRIVISAYRLDDPRDMGGFLPRNFEKPDDKAELSDALKTWINTQVAIFVETWNASLASDAVAMNERPNANTLARYDARTKANAAEWNARGGRRTKRRKSLRRKTRKNLTLSY